MCKQPQKTTSANDQAKPNDQEQTAAQMWITSDSGDQVMETTTRYCRIHQYGPGSACAGEWLWITRSQSNWKQMASDIVGSEAEAKAMAKMHAALSDAELIEIAAQEHLKALDEIGYQPRSSIDYSRGYDDGYKAAMKKLAEFLDLNLTEE